MQGLANKYRPMTLSGLVGQPVVVRYLQKLCRDRLHKNLILAGSYGSGKTTSGRIYARAMLCDSPTEDGPCNQCENCTNHINERNPDYYESDGATNGNVEEIRKLVELANTPPQFGKVRVILIDECHALSAKAWDALLKAIEEPPPFLVWIFATTEPGKVREAIRSRCQILQIKEIDNASAKAHLKKVAALEALEVEEAALDLIIALSKGHPRDLLKNLDAIKTLGTGTLADAKGLFNMDFTEELVALGKAAINGGIVSALQAVSAWGEDPQVKARYLVELFTRLSMEGIGHKGGYFAPAIALIPDQDIMQLVGDAEARGYRSDALVELIRPIANRIFRDDLSLAIAMVKPVAVVSNTSGAVAQDAPSQAPIGDESPKMLRRRVGRQFISRAADPITTPVFQPQPIQVQTPIQPVQIPLEPTQQIAQPVQAQAPVVSAEITEFDMGPAPQPAPMPVQVPVQKTENSFQGTIPFDNSVDWMATSGKTYET